MTIVALIGAVVTILGQILSEYLAAAPERRRKADALAALELKDTQDAMAAVDAELDGVQPDQRQPILLSPDDHL